MGEHSIGLIDDHALMDRHMLRSRLGWINHGILAIVGWGGWSVSALAVDPPAALPSYSAYSLDGLTAADGLCVTRSQPPCLPLLASASLKPKTDFAKEIVSLELPTGISAQAAVDRRMAQATPDDPLDLPPEIYEQSPVLQRWLEAPPDVRAAIRHDPSFRSRLFLTYTDLTAGGDGNGVQVGIEDWFVGASRLTLNADYARSGGDRYAWGSDVRYYLRPLGAYVNVAPTVGYRAVSVDGNQIDDVAVGLHLSLALSRTGAADVTLTQQWLNLGRDREVSLTTLSAGYAITSQLRLATTIQQQNATFGRDRTVGVGLEWLLD